MSTHWHMRVRASIVSDDGRLRPSMTVVRIGIRCHIPRTFTRSAMTSHDLRRSHPDVAPPPAIDRFSSWKYPLHQSTYRFHSPRCEPWAGQFFLSGAVVLFNRWVRLVSERRSA